MKAGMNVVLDEAEEVADGGHSPPYVTMVADFASLYPPYTCRGFRSVLQGRSMLRPYGNLYRACRGAKPLCVLFYPPKSGGSRGLKADVQTALMRLDDMGAHLDSRLRGNDKVGAGYFPPEVREYVSP